MLWSLYPGFLIDQVKRSSMGAKEALHLLLAWT